jgi:nucleoside-diphosphate-sugar epimerase
MTILITGSSGFVGSHLVSLCLHKNLQIIGVDLNPPHDNFINHPSFQFVQCDITDSCLFSNILNMYSPNVVFNLAAQTDIAVDTPSSLAVNYLPIITLLDFLRNHPDSMLIHTSTMLVCPYGHVDNLPNQHFQPSTSYGYSKLIAENLLLDARALAPRVKIARLTSIWGPGMYGPIRKLFLSKKLFFTSSSFKGSKTFSFVDNCCSDLLDLSYDQLADQITLIGDTNSLSTDEFIRSVQSASSSLFRKSFLVDVPYFLLYLLAFSNSILTFFGLKFSFLSLFHLSNYRNSNVVKPLYRFAQSERCISFEDAVKKTLLFYRD